MRLTFALQGHERGQRGKSGITVVGATPAVQLAVADYRDPGTQAVFPTDHLRLLVEVTVHQHRVVTFARNLHEDKRCAAGEAHDFARHASDILLSAPVEDLLRGVLDVTVRLPVGVEHG